MFLSQPGFSDHEQTLSLTLTCCFGISGSPMKGISINICIYNPPPLESLPFSWAKGVPYIYIYIDTCLFHY